VQAITGVVQEVGGICVEVEQEGKRLVLDVGLPLDADLSEEHRMPPVVGLSDGTTPCWVSW